MYICVNIQIYIITYIYMYTYKKNVCKYIYICIYTHVYIIYICAFQIEMTSVWIIMENLTFSDNFTETT